MKSNKSGMNAPNARIIATTRRQMLDVPVSGPRIAIEPLSEDQQMAIARARFGAAGAKIVDDAWRTAGVRELISTPLYLSALLSGDSHGTSPTTKEEVLRLFVEQHERASDHAEALLATLFGCHPRDSYRFGVALERHRFDHDVGGRRAPDCHDGGRAAT